MLCLYQHINFMDQREYGALYVKNGVNFGKIQDGGHQEKDKRAGTENVAGIIGLGSAIEIAYKNIENYNKKLLELREYYISNVEKRIKDIYINGARNNRLPGNANISFKGVDGNSILLKLDEIRSMCINRLCLQFGRN